MATSQMTESEKMAGSHLADGRILDEQPEVTGASYSK
jgi:hypothetical protein